MSRKNVKVEACLNWMRENTPTVIAGGIVWLLCCFVIFQKLTGNQLVNKHMGFKIKGPVGWHRDVARDKMSAVFRKDKRDPQSPFIRFTVEMGNPYGSGALEYILQGIIPQIQYTYGLGDSSLLQYRSEPVAQDINGWEWATVSFYLNFDELHVVYAAMGNNNVYVLILNTRGKDREKDEKLFRGVLRGIKIDHLQSRNVFIEAVANNP
jgi:hypothetical protein